MNFLQIQHGVVDSTSERAFAALEAGDAQHGDVHIALGQSAGRGRRGRVWHSPSGEGVYLSVILMPGPPPHKPAALTLAAGLAVVEALNDLGLSPFTDLAPHLKWPNDVLVGEAKICGILTESRALDPQRPHYVIGLGLNVRQRQFPSELIAERRVTSLARLEIDTTVEAATEAVLARLNARLEQVRRQHRRLAEDFLTASGLAGRSVRVQCGRETWFGVVRSLSLVDGLELATTDGELRSLPLEFVQSVEAEG